MDLDLFSSLIYPAWFYALPKKAFMDYRVRGAIRRVDVPASFSELWCRMRKRPAGSVLATGRLPSIDVYGLTAHADYIDERRRADSTLGVNRLCVLLAEERRVYCSVDTMRNWLSSHAAPSAIEAPGLILGATLG